ncbi:ATP-dependent RNA helicase DeaD [Verrucomicrobium sp. GAS474]|uniref:DEAD/DEAH box helicase n=1 Tax=Verrucomicrobium sp. GAS474 TaxID=1882831 RepID=UPI00087B19DB|nr:DEAD/DEAH box helicase [Verrucomicrobium sp. GAS474]SDT89324.1 ATP-dependent RNA helicase DeaD [Verrucomicrobium sp. GAS474]
MQKKPFSELGLSPEVLKAVAQMGFEEASHIQSQAIPPLLSGSDVVGQSQTGSGKTAAFAIPAIECVDVTLRAPQVLILCPTRELAVQVAEEVAKLSAFKKGVRELPIYGGQSYDRQLKGLQNGAQIIIGTPGRVMDHLERGTLKLAQIKMVILDEADRMLDMGFVDDIRTILSKAPVERQTVFFSATMPKVIQGLIKTFTKNPVQVAIEAQARTMPAIDQVYYEVDRRAKVDVLCRLIDLHDIKLGIIFCATKMMVDDLTEHLIARGYQADKMHGDMTQAMRERVINKFRRKNLEFLIATDVAARGIDVDDVEVVFNYDLPNDGEDYIHRIGRTGRAGRSGKAITFVAGREIYKMENIIRFTQSKVRREKVPSEEEVEAKRANAFSDLIRKTLDEGKYDKQEALIGRLLDQGHSATDLAAVLLHLLQKDEAKPAATPAPADKFSSRDDRPARGGDRFDRGDRPQRSFDRPAPAYGDRAERPRFDKFEKPARSERAPRGAAFDRPEREEGAHSHEAGMTRLILGAGKDHDIRPGDLLGVIVGTTKLPKETVGVIRLMPKQSFVDVAEDHADAIVDKLSGITFKGRKLWIKRAVQGKGGAVE